MIDLHSHSIHSDGQLSVMELLKLAEKTGIKIFSITDHNNVDAHLQNINVSDYFSGNFLVGCEFNCAFDGIRIEFLGYNFNPIIVKKWLDIYYSGNKFYEDSMNQFNDLYNLCKKHNIIIDEVPHYDPYEDFPASFIHSLVIKYPENKIIIGDLAFEKSSIFYRECTTNKEYILYCDFSLYTPSALEVSNLIRSNGGLVFFAHPYGYKTDDYEKLFNDLVNDKLVDGFECYHSSFNAEKTKKLLAFCREKKLLVSGGSDFHRFEKKIMLGHGINNNLDIDTTKINDWVNKKNKFL